MTRRCASNVPDSRDPHQLVLPLDVPATYFQPRVPPAVQQFLDHLVQPHRHSAPC